MKNILYCSSMQLDKHPLNSRSKFSSTIDLNNLNFLSDDSIEVAIKSIMLDTDASHNIIIMDVYSNSKS